MKMLATAALIAALSIPAAAHAQRDPTQMLTGADSNGDGVVTRAEFMAERAQRFDKMDRNKDGAVSPADFKRLAKFRPDAVERLNAMIAEIDANHDVKVTRSELADAPAPIFDRADADQNGRVDAAEIASARARIEAAKQKR